MIARQDNARVEELLAAEATEEFGRAEREELERLLRGRPAAGRDDMMEAAGLAQLAFLKADAGARRAMPEELRRRLARRGEAWHAERRAADDAV